MSLITPEIRRRVVQISAEIIGAVETTPAGLNVHAALESLWVAIDDYWAEECGEVVNTTNELLAELDRE
jgi:hypothetical protein